MSEETEQAGQGYDYEAEVRRYMDERRRRRQHEEWLEKAEREAEAAKARKAAWDRRIRSFQVAATVLIAFTVVTAFTPWAALAFVPYAVGGVVVLGVGAGYLAHAFWFEYVKGEEEPR